MRIKWRSTKLKKKILLSPNVTTNNTIELTRYSAVKGFVQVISETNDFAGQRELIAEYLEAEVRIILYTVHSTYYIHVPNNVR